MGRPRLHLIECLDSAGAAPADARVRTTVLERLGWCVRTQVVRLEPVPAETTWTGAGCDGDEETLVLDAAGRATLARWVTEERPDRVVIASAALHGGVVAAALPAHADVTWWPTGVAAGPARDGGIGRTRSTGILAFDGGLAGVGDALDGAVIDGASATRRRLPLWDGDFVLAPTALTGDSGDRALRAFESLTADWSAMDLVVLGHPDPACERAARALGIGTRVHCVGPAPREAEWVWWTSASAGLFAGDGAISSGMVARGLAAGCPLIAASEDAPLAAWLGRRRLRGTASADTPAAIAAALGDAFARTPAVGEAVARGLALARTFEPSAVAERLRATAVAAPAAPRQAA